MVCPICGGKSRILEVRSDGESTYRRRKCLECGETYYTSESDCTKEVFNRVRYISLTEYKKRREERGEIRKTQETGC